MDISTIFSRLFNKTGNKTLNDITKIDGQIVFTESGELYVDFSDDNRIKISDIVITDDLYSINELHPNKLYFDKSTGIISRYSEEDARDYPINLEKDLTRKIENYEFSPNGEIDADAWNPLMCSGKIIIDKNDKYGFCYSVNGTTLTCILLDNKSNDKFEKIKYYGDPFIEITDESLFEIIDSVLIGYNGNKSNIVIPYKINNTIITGIGGGMFKDHSEITSIILPNSITNIYSEAFQGCTNLLNINFPDKLTEIGLYSFRGCTNLKDIVIPNSVSYIDDSAFRGCTNLKDIILSSNIRHIGTDAFYSCPNTIFYVTPNTYAEQWCIENNEKYQYLNIDNSIINYQGEITNIPENPKPYYAYKLLNNLSIIEEISNEPIIFYQYPVDIKLVYNETKNKIAICKSKINYCINPDNTNTPLRKILLIFEANVNYICAINFTGNEEIDNDIIYIDETNIERLYYVNGIDPDPVNVTYNEYCSLLKNNDDLENNIRIVIEDPNLTLENEDSNDARYIVNIHFNNILNFLKDSLIIYVDGKYKLLASPPVLSEEFINDEQFYYNDEGKLSIKSIPGELMGEFDTESGDLKITLVNEDAVTSPIKYVGLTSGKSISVSKNYSSNNIHVYAELYDNYTGRAQNHLVKIEHGTKTYFATSTNTTSINVTLDSATGILTLNNINTSDENLTTIYFSIISGNYIDSVEVVEDYTAFAITYFSLTEGSSKTINNYDSSKVLVYAELYDGYMNQFGMIKIIEGSNTYFGTSTNGTTIDVELTSDGVITLNNINDTDGDDTNNLQKINFILMNVSSPESE